MGEAPRKSSFVKRLVGFLIKIVLAALLIGWLWRSGRLDLDLLTTIGLSSRVVGLVLLGVTSVFAGQLLLTQRLRLLLRSQRLEVPYPRVLGLTLIGAFFGSVLPGLVSGDAVKAVYLLGDAAGARGRAVAAVLIDRIIGLYSLFLLGCLALLAAWVTGSLPPGMPMVAAAPLAVIALTAVLALLAWRGLGGLPGLRQLSSRAPQSLRNLVETFREGLRRPALLAVAVVLSLINHSLVIVTFLIAGALLADGVRPALHFIVDPLAMVLNVLPLTPGGIGITEGAFSFLFEAIGSPHGAAVGLLGRIIQYIDYVIGGTLALLVVRFRRP